LLNKYTLKAVTILSENFPKILELKAIKNFLHFLKKKFEELSKLTQMFNIENEPLEEEEINRPQYYKLKRYAAIILTSMDNLYNELGMDKTLTKYRRFSYKNCKSRKFNDAAFCSNDIETKFSINLLNYESYQESDNNEIVPDEFLSDTASTYELADFFRIRYIESKKQTLMLKNKRIMTFMNNSSGHHDCFETFHGFFIETIKNIKPRLFRSTNEVHPFWQDPFMYILLQVWNNMLTESTEFRQNITKTLELNTNARTVDECTDIQKCLCI